MSTRSQSSQHLKVLQGTVDLLIRRMLIHGLWHGRGIRRALEPTSDGVPLVDYGSLFAGRRLLDAKGRLAAAWGTSTNIHTPRFDSLPERGRA